MDSSMDWKDLGACALVLGGLIGFYSGFGWLVSSTSGSEDQFGETLSSPSDYTESMGGSEPAMAGIALSTTGIGVYNTFAGGGGGDIIIRIFLKNTVPYSRVEKRAQQTYDLLHGKGKTEWRVPAVAAESREGLEAFTALFGDKPSGDRLTETLSVLERVLEQDNDKQPA